MELPLELKYIVVSYLSLDEIKKFFPHFTKSRNVWKMLFNRDFSDCIKFFDTFQQAYEHLNDLKNLSVYFGEIELQVDVLDFIADFLPISQIKSLMVSGNISNDMKGVSNFIENCYDDISWKKYLEKLELETTIKSFGHIDWLSKTSNTFFKNGIKTQKQGDVHELQLISSFLSKNNPDDTGSNYHKIYNIALSIVEDDVENVITSIYKDFDCYYQAILKEYVSNDLKVARGTRSIKYDLIDAIARMRNLGYII